MTGHDATSESCVCLNLHQIWLSDRKLCRGREDEAVPHAFCGEVVVVVFPCHGELLVKVGQ